MRSCCINFSSFICATSGTPLRGELKCIQVGDDELPVDANSLKGEATIETVRGSAIDARSYNAIGIQAIEGANNRDNTLILSFFRSQGMVAGPFIPLEMDLGR